MVQLSGKNRAEINHRLEKIFCFKENNFFHQELSSFWVSSSIYELHLSTGTTLKHLFSPFWCAFSALFLFLTEKDLEMLEQIIWTSKECAQNSLACQNTQQIDECPSEDKLKNIQLEFTMFLLYIWTSVWVLHTSNAGRNSYFQRF